MSTIDLSTIDGNIIFDTFHNIYQFGAGNEIRTRDPNLGKVMLYQLSYSRLNEL